MRAASKFSDNPNLKPLDSTEEGLAAVAKLRDFDGVALIEIGVGRAAIGRVI